MLTITCEDCMDMMARYPDKYFDLAIVDPPYGIGETWKKQNYKKYRKHIFPDTTYRNNVEVIEEKISCVNVSKK
jgi:site-specific DNA-methyltransferase (adenine-specific)